MEPVARYTPRHPGRPMERGIKEIDGFMSERWRTEPEYAIKVDPSLGILGVLLEPATVVTKALEHVAEIGRRSFWEPRKVLVTGAGPIGLLAALIAKLHAREVHVLDRMETGPKPDLVRALGATYHSGSVEEVGFEPDAIIESTGVGQVIAESIQTVASSGIVCLTGVGHGGVITSAACADIAAATVLKNDVIERSAYQPGRHAHLSANGETRFEDHPRIYRGSTDRRGCRVATSPLVGRDGEKRGLRSDVARVRQCPFDGPPGRSDHDVCDDRPARRLSGFPANPSLHTRDLPASLCDHGLG